MSILDEDKSNFNKDDDRYRCYSKMISEYVPLAEILVSNCHGILCHKCIGRKYNIKNGCPVCGSTAVTFIRMHDSVYGSMCDKCGSIITICINGNIAAVGIQNTELKMPEDII